MRTAGTNRPTVSQPGSALASPRGRPVLRSASGDYRGGHRSGTARARGRAALPGRIVALIPAHDEAGTIRAAIRALRDQTRRPDRVLVVADNCSDDTALLAVASPPER